MNDELRGYLLGCSDMAEEQGDDDTAASLRWLAMGGGPEGKSLKLQILQASDAQVRRMYVPGVRTSTGEVLRSPGFKRIERTRGTEATLALVFDDIPIHGPGTAVNCLLMDREERACLETPFPVGERPTFNRNDTLRVTYSVKFSV